MNTAVKSLGGFKTGLLEMNIELAVMKISNIRSIFSSQREEYVLEEASGRKLFKRIDPQGKHNCPVCRQNSWHLTTEHHITCKVCDREYYNLGVLGMELIEKRIVIEQKF